MLQIGSVLDGKYKILNEIGHGGMSVVYLALNERANKTWAIKEVRKDGGADSEVLEQGLVAETEMLKKLNHPHLPSIIDVIDRDESFIIVMDYIEGNSLQDLLKHGGAQNKDMVVEWAKQLCDVLGYLHSRKPPIIYRDMKPANVMLKPDGSVTLIDFGTAREYKQHSEGDTTWLGTRGYAAPEQFGGRGQTDGRTDIYCLGATMYHLLTGYSPADTNFVILPLRELNPAFANEGIEEIVAKCCEPNPANRYQNCAELMYALEHEKELGQGERRKRKAKITAFFASIAVALLGIIGMIAFTLVARSAVLESYDTWVESGDLSIQSMTLGEESAQCYKNAMKLQPSNPEAFDHLLSAMEKDYTFSYNEGELIRSVIMETNGKSRSYLDQMKNSNIAEYDRFCYRLANDYFFFYEGSDYMPKASTWYDKVTQSQNLSASNVNLANILYRVGFYYDSLNKNESTFMVEGSGYSFLDLWNDLVAVTDGDVADKLGGDRYAAKLYGEFLSQITQNARSFKQFGISEDAMQSQISKIQQGLGSLIPENTAVSNMVEEYRSMAVPAAQAAVAAQFAKAGQS